MSLPALREDHHLYFRKTRKGQPTPTSSYHQTEVMSLFLLCLGFQPCLFAKKDEELSCNSESFVLSSRILTYNPESRIHLLLETTFVVKNSTFG